MKPGTIYVITTGQFRGQRIEISSEMLYEDKLFMGTDPFGIPKYMSYDCRLYTARLVDRCGKKHYLCDRERSANGYPPSLSRFMGRFERQLRKVV